MKKWMFGIPAGLLILVMVINLLGIVSALDLVEGSNQVIDWVKEFSSPFLEAIFGSPEYIFEKFLFFILVLSISYVALNKSEVFGDNETIIWVLSVAVSLLATRFLTETEVVQTILLQYTVLGIVLTAAIPLIIFFFFAESFESSIMRKILWVFFIVVFIGIWNSRKDDVGQLAWIYFFTGVAALIFLLADGTIRRAIVKQQMSQLGYNNREQLGRELRNEILKATEDVRKNIITPSQGRKIVRRLQKQLKAVQKM